MPSLYAKLDSFPLTTKIHLRDRVLEPDRDLAYYKVTLKNGYVMFIRELYTPEGKFYSYHLQDRGNNTALRYDNAPHHKETETFPHHKHIGRQEKVVDLNDPDLDAFLDEVQDLLSDR